MYLMEKLPNTDVRLIRDGVVIYTGALGSLKRFKDDVKEVAKGYECGLNIEKFNDIKLEILLKVTKKLRSKNPLVFHKFNNKKTRILRT